jgi:hypothetical protein
MSWTSTLIEFDYLWVHRILLSRFYRWDPCRFRGKLSIKKHCNSFDNYRSLPGIPLPNQKMSSSLRLFLWLPKIWQSIKWYFWDLGTLTGLLHRFATVCSIIAKFQESRCLFGKYHYWPFWTIQNTLHRFATPRASRNPDTIRGTDIYWVLRSIA